VGTNPTKEVPQFGEDRILTTPDHARGAQLAVEIRGVGAALVDRVFLTAAPDPVAEAAVTLGEVAPPTEVVKPAKYLQLRDQILGSVEHWGSRQQEEQSL
jgi:hypothetical protein